MRAMSMVMVVGLLGCGGPRAFTRGQYSNPNEIEMLSDQFNENDMQLIAKKMVGSLAESAAFKKIQGQPLLIVGKMQNKTSEHIDMKSLGDMVRVEMSKTQKFAFVDKDAREEVAEEYEYQNSGYVDPNKAKGPGGQASADYLMTGNISSITQEVGADKVVYYKTTMQLTNLKTGVIEWTEQKEIRKKFEKQRVSS